MARLMVRLPFFFAPLALTLILLPPLLLARLPLYYPLKTLYLLYLALPQTSGSAWL